MQTLWHGCADAVRMVWALFYWNVRKARYVKAGRQGPCPCHNPSDSGRAGETRCEAVLYWAEPARFRRVCPLLQRRTEGWRCSVAAVGVRPFWSRAAGWSGLLAAILYLLAGVGVWGGLRLSGVRTLTPVDLWWPGHWAHVPTARAELFLAQAGEALGAGEARRAHVALGAALALDPDNYRARLLMAQINQFEGAVLHGDDVFQDLLARHPEQRGTIAMTYHDTLLALGRVDRLAEFCLQMTQADTSRVAEWVRSLLLTLRISGRAEEFTRVQAARCAELAPHARLLLQAEVAWQQGRAAAAIESLRRPYLGPVNPIYAWLHINALREYGEPALAMLVCDYYAPVLSEEQRVLFWYSTERAGGRAGLDRDLWAQLVRQPLDEATLGRVLATLIAEPDLDAFRSLHQALIAPTVAGYRPGPGEMWVTAVVCGALDEADEWARRAESAGLPRLPNVEKIDFASGRTDQPNTVFAIINQVSLPRDMVYRLLLRQAAVRQTVLRAVAGPGAAGGGAK